MFVDLVGSTALAADRDAEDLRDIIWTYSRCCAEVVERHGGTVAQYLGDGVLVCFGYPQAGEDAAERAVRAGLAVIAEVAALELLPAGRLHTRVGAATGMVVVGELLRRGRDGRAERARRDAESRGAAAGAGRAGHAGDLRQRRASSSATLFECRSLGALTLKGFPAPVPAHVVLREREVESRFFARARRRAAFRRSRGGRTSSRR